MPADQGASAVLDALEGGRFARRTVLVVAHPDDETVSLGGLLPAFADLLLVHATDGAPADMADARRLGFSSREAYRQARATELEAALVALGSTAARWSYGLPDQGVADALTEFSRDLQAEIAGAALVVTHAYEGGHPDHDGCAFAVQAACARLARTGRSAPVRLEFPSYHQAGGGRTAGRFRPDPDLPERVYRLSADRMAAKRAALAAHRTQAEVLAWFTEPEVERLRPAPDYEFTAEPPPGAALYDQWGWSLTSRVWRERAGAALRELDLGGEAA